MEFLGFRFVINVGLGVFSHCVELVRIMLRTWNLVLEYRHICSFRKDTFQYQNFPKFADVSMFCKKKNNFLTELLFICIITIIIIIIIIIMFVDGD